MKKAILVLGSVLVFGASALATVTAPDFLKIKPGTQVEEEVVRLGSKQYQVTRYEPILGNNDYLRKFVLVYEERTINGRKVDVLIARNNLQLTKEGLRNGNIYAIPSLKIPGKTISYREIGDVGGSFLSVEVVYLNSSGHKMVKKFSFEKWENNPGWRPGAESTAVRASNAVLAAHRLLKTTGHAAATSTSQSASVVQSVGGVQ